MQAFCKFCGLSWLNLRLVRRDIFVVKCAPLLGARLVAGELNGKQVREHEFPMPELPPQR